MKCSPHPDASSITVLEQALEHAKNKHPFDSQRGVRGFAKAGSIGGRKGAMKRTIPSHKPLLALKKFSWEQ